MDVRIAPLELADATAVAELYRRNAAYLAPSMPALRASAEAQAERVAALVAERAQDLAYGFTIHGDGELVGVISLFLVARGAFQSAHVGYWVSEHVAGRGVATRAVGAVVAVAFDELGLHRLEAGTLPENAASQRVLEKNGFRRFGAAPYYLQIGGRWREHLLFQLTVEGRP